MCILCKRAFARIVYVDWCEIDDDAITKEEIEIIERSPAVCRLQLH